MLDIARTCKDFTLGDPPPMHVVAESVMIDMCLKYTLYIILCHVLFRNIISLF